MKYGHADAAPYRRAHSNTGLAQTAEWTDENLKFVVGTMADQIVATIC